MMRRNGLTGGRGIRKSPEKQPTVTIYTERDNIYFKEIVKRVANQRDKSFNEVTNSEIVESLRTWNGSDFEGIITYVRGNDLKTAFDKKIREIIAEIAKASSKPDKVTNDEIAAHLLREGFININIHRNRNPHVGNDF